MTEWNNRIESFALADRITRLQLTDDADLAEIDECLTRALELDPDNIEALQEAAHFYDAVMPDIEKARIFAARCRAVAMVIASEMDNILADGESLDDKSGYHS